MITTTITGVGSVATGLENTTNGVIKAAFLGVIEGLKIANEGATKLISASDHSLKELAAMGHPYGFTHPQIIHDPDETVHAQTGEYLAALTVEKPTSNASRDIIDGQVHIAGDPDMVKLDREIQLGTEKMRKRPWARRVVETSGDDIRGAIEDRVIAAVMRDSGADGW